MRDRMLLDEFKEQRNVYLEMSKVVQKEIESIVKDTKVFTMVVSCRVKEVESLSGKLNRKSGKYQKLTDITDLLGARVITYFQDGVDIIGKEIEKRFVVDWANSVDKRATIEATSFGYLSLHYICSLPEDKGYPEEFKGIRFEIQLRTILQHVWAETEHDLGYKSEFGLPRVIERDFSRLAGLLELADNEFLRVRNSTNAYTADVKKRIKENRAEDVPLDTVSLREYVVHNERFRAFLSSLAKICGAEIEDISPEVYIPQLRFLGINMIGGLQKLLEDNEELAYRLAERLLATMDLDILSSSVALFFLCRAELIRTKASPERMMEFFLISTSDKSRVARQVQRLISVADEILKKRK